MHVGFGQKIIMEKTLLPDSVKHFIFQKPIYCTLIVSAHHHFKLKVNGTKVGGLISPAPSIFQETKLVLRYDISELLQPGENVSFFYCSLLGEKGQNHTKGTPGLILEL